MGGLGKKGEVTKDLIKRLNGWLGEERRSHYV